MFRKIIKILSLIILCFFILWWTAYFIINQPRVQTYLVQKATEYFSEQLKTKISISSVSIEFFKKLVLENILIQDQNNDTLLFAEKLKIDFDAFNWRKNKFKVQYLGLKNCTINLKRKKESNDFNYEFLTNSTSSKDTSGNITIKNSEEKITLDFSLKKLDFENIALIYRDEKTEEQIEVKLGKGVFNPDIFDFKKKQLTINDILFDKALVGYTILKGDYHTPWPDTIPFVHINNSDWKIAIGNLKISDSEFYYINEMFPPDSSFGMDYFNLFVSDIDFNLGNINLIGDTISAKINHLSAKERSGFVLNDMTCDLKMNTTEIVCNHLKITTPYSKVGNFYSMKYQSLFCFKDYIPLVKMTGDFKNSEVSFKDIAYFAPALKSLNQKVILNGKAKGEVNKLKGEEIKIRFGKSSFFSGDFNLRGLPDIEETFIDFKVNNIKTDANDIALFVDKSLLPNTISRFGNINFQGRFTGFIYDFVANGNFETGIGNLSSDLNLKVNKHTNKTGYSGRLSADNFNLGIWLNQSTLGKISGNGKIFGSGLTLENLSTKIIAKIEKLEFKDYPYSKISIDGEFNKKLFNGQLLTHDPNINIDFIGKIDFNNELPAFDLNSTIQNAHLKNLNLTADDYTVNTNIKLDFTGNNIDNFFGDIRINNTFITKKDSLVLKKSQSYNLENLLLKAIGENPSKTITINADFMNAKIQGNFLISELPTAITQFVKNYIPSAPINDTSKISKQNFDFEIRINQASSFAQFIFSSLQKFNEASISGKFNSEQKILSFNADIPEFIYKDIRYRNWQTTALSKQGQLHTKTLVKNIFISDSSQIENTNITASLTNDRVEFDIKANDTFPNRINLNGVFAFSPDSTQIKILNSSIFVNGKQWDIPATNSFVIKPNSLVAHDFVLQHEDQKVSLNSNFDIDSTEALKIQLLNVDLADFSNTFQIAGYTFKGKIFGSVELFNPLEVRQKTDSLWRANAFTGYFSIQEFSIDDDTIGKLTIKASQLDTSDIIHLRAELVNNEQRVEINGDYYYNIIDSLNKKSGNQIDFRIAVENYPLKIAELFLPRDISSTHGFLSGNLVLNGSLHKPVLTGKVKCQNAGSTINYLNTHYTFDNEEVVFDRNKIRFSNIQLQDVKKNTANLDGYFYHSYFKNFTMDLNITTDNFQLLNTTEKNNSLYYGTGFGQANIHIGGNFENTDMKISAKTKKGTLLFIPVADEKEFYKPEFITFINKNKNIVSPKKYSVDLSGVKLNFDLEVTPDAEIQIEFKEDIGGTIKGKGNANIKMEISALGDFNMYGVYTIENGDYFFRWQTYLPITKKFTIDKGGTITWFGDPYEAKLNINTIYKLRASAFEFIATSLVDEQDKIASKKRIPVDLYLALTASLLSPVIDFDIRIPEDNSAPFTNLLVRRLLELEKNELNRQAAALLVMNKFVPPAGLSSETSAGTTNDVGSGAITSGTEVFSNMASNMLSQIVSNNITDLDVIVNYRSYESVGFTPDELDRRNEFQIALSKQFFKNRMIVDIGGGTDFGNGTPPPNATSSGNFTGDFAIQYKLSEDGRYRVKVFGKSEDDIINIEGRNKNKAGFGFLYKREYDKFSDLWKSYKKKKAEERK